ncbi:MAG: DUF1549 and DUF1553 domain-containing protein [Verrucomicrobiales bacterium]|nr:DUF1549 and DUF1553 domain-containing protein [Verrucomicrobiales bacterium]
MNATNHSVSSQRKGVALLAVLALTTAIAFAASKRGEYDEARAHWAYQPVKKAAEPGVTLQSWAKTPVDSFILAKLEAKGMKPSPPASRETLLRRVTFDLIGLPPTTDELKAFLADHSPNAFATVVDRLLTLPHFGERWGRHWLDTARYSDTAGRANNTLGETYRYAYAWSYRDYVISAFNDDKPYDRFILEQLAADKLPLGDDKSPLAALGFLTVGERFQNRNDIINDRIDTTTKAFLGLTVACARCHDHMTDPIPTADYYSLHGIFNSTFEPVEKPLLTSPKNRAAMEDFAAKRRVFEQKNVDVYYEVVGKLDRDFRQKAEGYLLFAMIEPNRRAGGATDARDEIAKRFQLDDKLARGGELRNQLLGNGRTDDPVWGPWLRFSQLRSEDFAMKGRALADEIAANAASPGERGWNPLVAAQFKGAAPRSMQDVAALYGALCARIEPQAADYFAAKRRATTDVVDGFDSALAQLLEKPLAVQPGGNLTTEQIREVLARWPRGLRSHLPFAFDAINELDLTHPGAPSRAMTLQDTPAATNSPIFIRGQAEVRGAVVPRRFLEIFSGPARPEFKEGSGRLELARAIASQDNPLTARVLVNRVWMHLFGEGFVPTPDDLGVQSEPPSHRELVDWLARYFMDNGWSQKKLIRLILLSNVYRQSSEDNPQYTQLDANNRLLWRANIRRLDFEAIRDSLLVFSGKLDPRIGGQPINLTEEPYSFRRSVYGYVDRGNLPELMQQFDFSDPDMPNSKRATTVVPQQALFLMNSPMAVDVTRRIVARKEFTAATDDAGRVNALYIVIFQRAPRPEEVRLGLACVNELKGTAGKSVATPAQQPQARRRGDMSYGPGRAPVRNQGEAVDRRPLTAWEHYAQALLFANELVYVN